MEDTTYTNLFSVSNNILESIPNNQELHARTNSEINQLNDEEIIIEDKSNSQIETNQDSNLESQDMMNQIAISKWNFHKAGGLKRFVNEIIRQRYKCSNHQTNSKTAIFEEIGNEKIFRWNGSHHNHPPPFKVRTDPQIKKIVVKLLRTGRTPSKIQAKLISEPKDDGVEISNWNVPTKKDMRNWGYLDKLNFSYLGCYCQYQTIIWK